MSVSENIAEHNDEVEAEVARMQELMSKTETGVNMLEKSQEMAVSDEMVSLMSMIGDPEYPEEERMTLAKYMGEMLQEDPENGLEGYADYLDGVLEDPEYESRKEYYGGIAEAARVLSATELYREYIKAYNEFEADESEEATVARKATREMQEKMQEWSQD